MEPINDEILFVDTKEACKLTGIGRNTMLRLTKMKGFPAIIRPRKILYDIKELPIWLSKNYGNYKKTII